MNRNRNTFEKGFTLIELLVVVAIIGLLSSIVLASMSMARAKGYDGARISEVRQIKYALELYYDANNNYPTCLSPGGSCVTTLAGTIYMNKVPKDPLTKLDYSYAAIGTSTLCTSVHIGTSLGDKTNRALLSGADAPAKGASFLCTGSLPDFSGLSYAVAGQPCNATAGTPQPTNAANGETCYDVI